MDAQRTTEIVSTTDFSDPWLYLPPLVVTGLLWWSSPHNVNAVQAGCAFLLMFIAWYSYQMWKRRKDETLPLFSMLAGAHWIYFGLPLFWGGRSLYTIWGEVFPSEDAITTAMVMCVVGVVALWAGMKMRVRPWKPSHLPDIPASKKSWTYLRAVMAAGIGLSMWDGAQMLLGSGGWQIMVIITTIVPSAAFALLFRHFLEGESTYVDRVLIFAFVVNRILLAGSSGWLSPVAAVGVMVVALYLSARRRLRILPVIAMFITVLFLQVGKNGFRQEYWYGQAEGTRVERLRYWMDESMSRWEQAWNDRDPQAARDLAAESLLRMSLLADSAYVLEKTPSLVPYQHGKTYSYLLVTLIPRFAWGSKPSVNEANRFYQTAYGLNDERSVTVVSRAIGFLTEGYMNFAWPGVVGIMFLTGMFLSFFQRTFLAPDSSMLFKGMGIAILPALLAIESQAAVYLAGFIQQVALTVIVMLPIIEIRRHRKRFVRRIVALESQA
jgi:hypothetical protein